MSAPEFKETEESIYDLLETIRKRPGMYICKPSLQGLRDFLGGYTAGLGRVRLVLRDTTDFHRFHDWVAHRLGFYESTSGWCNMIRDKSANEEEAFRKFYVLLDEFKKESARD
jgi:hypothetical protein